MHQVAFGVPGRYELKEELGAGGMGVVYRALDRERDQDVALKTFRRASAKDEYRLKREFRALAELSHPNLVALYDLVTDDDGPSFFTMELVDGVDPRTFCGHGARSSGDVTVTTVDPPSREVAANDNYVSVRPDYERVRSIMRQIAQGVSALHGHGRVHRDLKCGNLLVTRDGEVKLLDFGLVIHRGEDSRDPLEGHTMGTLGYMSPEQAGGGKELGPATDWYAVGAILFELLTGRLPFEGPVLRVIVDKQQREAPSPRCYNPDAPSDLLLLCELLLRREASERPRGDDILRVLGASGVVAASRARLERAWDEDEAFVGREAELAALVADFDGVQRGACRVRVLEGPSGLGKSTLVRAFAARVRETSPDLVLIESKCREQEHVRFRALDAAIDALCAAWCRLSAADAQALLPSDPHALLALFPVLNAVPAVAETRDRVVLPSDPDARRKLAVRALREVLVRFAARRPVVLFLDDFQWADRGSREILTDLLSGEDAPALYLVVAQREVERKDGGIVRPQPIEGLEQVTRRSDLTALDTATLAGLCRSRHPELSDATIAHVVAQSEGSPLFALELANHVEFAEDPLSKPTLHEVILGRLSRMSEPVRTLARFLALSEEALPQEVLISASSLPRSAFMDALAEARSARFLRHCAGALQKTYEPFHDQVRGAVRVMIEGEERLSMHARLAVAWETSSTPNPAAVAEHWFVAGDLERAAVAYAEAAELAGKALDYGAQANLLARLMEVRQAYLTDGERAELLVAKGKALTRAGYTVQAAEAFLEAAPHRADALALQAEAAGYLLASGQLSRGMDVGRRTLASLGERMPRSLWGVLLAFVGSDLRLRWRRYRPGRVKNARREALMRQQIETYFALAKGFNVAAPAYSTAFFAKAALLAAKVGDERKLSLTLGGYASMLAAFQPTQVRELLVRCQALASACEDVLPTMYAVAGEGYGYYFDADFRRALQRAEDALAVLQATPERHAFEEERMRMLASFARLYLGDLEGLAAKLPLALRELERRGDEYGAAMLRLGAGSTLHAMQGAPEAIRQDLGRIGHLEAWAGDYLSFYALLADVNLALYTADYGAAYERIVDGLPAWRRSGMTRMPLGDVVARTMRAQLAAGRYASASQKERRRIVRMIRSDARRLERMGHRYGRLVALGMRATERLVAGDAHGAARSLEQEERAMDALGMQVTMQSIRWLRGAVTGGADGEALSADAVVYLESLGVADPARFARLYIPFPPELVGAVAKGALSEG